MTKIEIFCQTLNKNFGGKDFSFDEVKKIIGNQIQPTTLKSYLSLAKRVDGIDIVGTIKRTSSQRGANKKVYRLRDLNLHKLVRLSTITTSKSPNEELFDDFRHPSKAYITNYFYSIFSCYCNKTKSILSLCGPNTERFTSNILKITNKDVGSITLIEYNPKRVKKISSRLSKSKKYLPPFRIFNSDLSEFLNSGFYQFQELDCEGNWDLLYKIYEERLLEQSSNKRLIKGMIITTFARHQTIDQLNIPFSALLSKLGSRFSKNIVLNKSVVKHIPGDWLYINMYDEYPDCTKWGRIKKLVSFKYSQKGSQMFTSLIIYR